MDNRNTYAILFKKEQTEFSFKILSYKVIIFGLDIKRKLLIKEFISNNIKFDSDISIFLINKIYFKFQGQYSICFCSSKKVLVSTDPYAIKKVYYFLKKNKVLISSFPELIVKGVQKEIDPLALTFYFVKGYVPYSDTIYKELKKIAPGNLLYLDLIEGSLKEESYLNTQSSNNISSNQLYHFFKKSLFSSVLESKGPKNKTLFLSGGLDSSILFKILTNNKLPHNVFIGLPQGIKHTNKLDFEYDLNYANRLVKSVGEKLNVISYDLLGQNVVDDFIKLRKELYTEYSPSLIYYGLCSQVDSNSEIINGQNADSILSFGDLGWPRIKDLRIVGLHGLITRYNLFFRYTNLSSNQIVSIVSNFLQLVYFKRKGNKSYNFKKNHYQLGLLLDPSKNPINPHHPPESFASFSAAEKVLNEIINNYIEPYYKNDKYNYYQINKLLHLNSYMQGNANRGTVVPALMNNVSINLPFTNIEILQESLRLKPSFNEWFYGKYFNIRLGKEIGVPDYIIKRNDPNNSDSTLFYYKSLWNNRFFRDFVQYEYDSINWEILNDVFTDSFIKDLKRKSNIEKNFATILKLIWINPLLINEE